MSVALSRREEIALLTLDRPEALNALSFAILDDIARAIDEAAGMDVRALVVTGAGERAFCAGADIKELKGQTPLVHRRRMRRGQDVFAKLDDLPVPSVAAINGYAFGGGLELALACTFRVATANARLGFPEIKLGLVPGYGGTQRLPRHVGEARALEMIMTGRAVPADEAARIGLVERLVDGDAVEGAIAFAREFTAYSLPVLGLARSAVTRALDVPLAEGFEIEADAAAIAYQTEDASEGIDAFERKREPEFRDR